MPAGVSKFLTNSGAQRIGYQYFNENDVRSFQNTVVQFELTLNAEVDDLPLFCILDRGNLSTAKLLCGASAGFPAWLLEKLTPSWREEIDEAGKCIAFRGSSGINWRCRDKKVTRYPWMWIRALAGPTCIRHYENMRVAGLEARAASPPVPAVDSARCCWSDSDATASRTSALGKNRPVSLV